MGFVKGAPAWNKGTGAGYVDQRGYRWIRVDGKSVREHRHLMEQAIGRKLSAQEVVHHRNGITTDNRLENLELMNNGDHIRVHHRGAERPDMTKIRISRAARDRGKIKELARALAALVDSPNTFSSHEKAKARALLERINK